MNVLSGLLVAYRKKWPKIGGSNPISSRMVLLGVLGIVLLLASSFFDSAPAKTKPEVQIESVKSSPAVVRSYEEALEGKLANLLTQVRGAGAVSVCITLENGAEQEYAKNTTRETRVIQEKDNSGGLRTTTETKETDQLLLSKDNGADHPVMVRETKPQIKGVLVIADGAQDSTVKANLTRAVEAGLGIPSYKITVLPQRR